tara:strand:+ start:242 stop:724 length:483 start_codon:yes stop_codon:yes gene_type:complete
VSGVINFLRSRSQGLTGRAFFIGGESENDGLNQGEAFTGQHYLTCSDPNISPSSCDECNLSWSYSDGSFVTGERGSPVEANLAMEQILKFYNEIAKPNADIAAYRPYQWKTIVSTDANSKYKSLNWLVDKDNDVWWVILELRSPESDNYIQLLQEQYVDD